MPGENVREVEGGKKTTEEKMSWHKQNNIVKIKYYFLCIIKSLYYFLYFNNISCHNNSFIIQLQIHTSSLFAIPLLLCFLHLPQCASERVLITMWVCVKICNSMAKHLRVKSGLRIRKLNRGECWMRSTYSESNCGCCSPFEVIYLCVCV